MSNLARAFDGLRGLARVVPLLDHLGKSALDLLALEGRVVTIRRGAASGLKWRCDHAYSHRIWIGVYEPLVQNVLASELRPGDVFWDVGCGPGIFSMLAWHLVGPKGAVISIDPIPRNIEVTRAQLELNGLPTTGLVEVALAEHRATEALLIPKRLGRSFLASVQWERSEQNYRAAIDQIEVQTQRADELAGDYPLPTLVKIDVEGSEDRVIAGCERILDAPRPPRLLIEAHSRSSAKRCHEMLAEAGYRFHPIDGEIRNKRAIQHLFADHPANPAHHGLPAR